MIKSVPINMVDTLLMMESNELCTIMSDLTPCRVKRASRPKHKEVGFCLIVLCDNSRLQNNPAMTCFSLPILRQMKEVHT